VTGGSRYRRVATRVSRDLRQHSKALVAGSGACPTDQKVRSSSLCGVRFDSTRLDSPTRPARIQALGAVKPRAGHRPAEDQRAAGHRPPGRVKAGERPSPPAPGCWRARGSRRAGGSSTCASTARRRQPCRGHEPARAPGRFAAYGRRVQARRRRRAQRRTGPPGLPTAYVGTELAARSELAQLVAEVGAADGTTRADARRATLDAAARRSRRSTFSSAAGRPGPSVEDDDQPAALRARAAGRDAAALVVREARAWTTLADATHASASPSPSPTGRHARCRARPARHPGAPSSTAARAPQPPPAGRRSSPIHLAMRRLSIFGGHR